MTRRPVLDRVGDAPMRIDPIVDSSGRNQLFRRESKEVRSASACVCPFAIVSARDLFINIKIPWIDFYGLILWTKSRTKKKHSPKNHEHT